MVISSCSELLIRHLLLLSSGVAVRRWKVFLKGTYQIFQVYNRKKRMTI